MKISLLLFRVLGAAFFISVYSKAEAKPEAEWSVLIYLQARNNLAPFAAANLDALAAYAGSPQVNFLAQWDQPRKPGSWRYKVEKNNVNLVNYVSAENAADIGGKLVDFVAWAKENYPAKKYCLIFWNHGIGIIDPSYGSKDLVGISNSDPLFLIRKEASLEKFYGDLFDLYSPKSSREEHASNPAKGLCPESIKPSQRGILFDEEYQTYMNSQDLEKSLEKICAILGKKISIIGFDACFMSNLEVAYQVEKFADYMVGSEELELPKGWDYRRISEFLFRNPTASPETLSRNIVQAYCLFYKDQTSMYTLTALKMDKIQSIKCRINMVLNAMENLSREERLILFSCVQESRKLAMQLTAKIFIDLGSWSIMLAQCLANRLGSYSNKKPFVKQGLDSLICQLQQLTADLVTCVLEHTTSSYLSKLTGLSIYFPIRSIESSYANCKFAIDSNWLAFIKTINIF